MKTWIALLRGLNVVGANQVPMKTLAAAFNRAGFHAVRTYIQSGNILFQSRRGRPEASVRTETRKRGRKRDAKR